MASKRKPSTKKTVFGTTKQQEAFARLVANGTPVTEAVRQISRTF